MSNEEIPILRNEAWTYPQARCYQKRS